MKRLITNLFIAVPFFTGLLAGTSKVTYAQVAPKALSTATIERLSRVPEFAYIRDLARQYGIKVYLFGGTAAAFGHYVRWDLEREAGDDKYQPERFDYDFTSIYRGNQDLDIVLDTDAETAKKFEVALHEKFPHFQGDKSAWEVRTLRTTIGAKSPLLNDYDFLNQHTDSNSTGLIDVSQLDAAQQAYFDLRDWQNPNSQFLNDVASGAITYYHSDTHHTTSRYRSGENPPILSAVRYLAKLTQYDVLGRPQDLQTVMEIVARTNFNELSAYSKEKLAQFSLKALLNAPDAEYAWNLLDDVGLRQKLIEWDKSNIDKVESLAWWMDKEPLRSFEVGQGNGNTAKELGIDIISHETKSFQAYENITRSARGRVNVFISRNGIKGEEAGNFEDGLYTLDGTDGGRGSGLTVRMHMHPQAREGKDFLWANSVAHRARVVIVRNKNAVRLIRESSSLTLPQYLRLLFSGSIGLKDQGLAARIERRLTRIKPTKEEIKESIQIVQEAVNQKDANASPLAMSVWINLPEAVNHPDIIESLIDGYNAEIAVEILTRPEGRNPKLLNRILAKDRPDLDEYVARHVLREPFWAKEPNYGRWGQILVDRILSYRPPDNFSRPTPPLLADFAIGVLSSPYSARHPEWVVDLASKYFSPEFKKISRMRGYNDEDTGHTFFREALENTFWTENSILLKYLDGKSVTIEHIVERNEHLPFREWLKTQKQKSIGPIANSCDEILVGT